MAKKVLVIYGDYAVKRMFSQRGWIVLDDQKDANAIMECDLMVFCGGADISPALYGEANVASHCHPGRDEYEEAWWEDGYKLSVPMVGICRGAQLLNVLSGGSMWQDVNNHAIGGEHPMWCEHTKKTVMTTSYHHQMMRPSEEGIVICATPEYASRFTNASGTYTDQGPDVEVVFYEDTKCLCYQGHPEFVNKHHECQEHFFTLVKDLLGVGDEQV